MSCDIVRNSSFHNLYKLSYKSRLKYCIKEVWLSLAEEGFVSETKLDIYINHYMDFFREQIKFDGHNLNDLKEDVIKNIKSKYEKRKVAQCSVCGELGAGVVFWGNTKNNWEYKVCKKCNTEKVKCACCGKIKARKTYPVIEEENRYSDICTVCTNKTKSEVDKEMSSLELEDYIYNNITLHYETLNRLKKESENEKNYILKRAYKIDKKNLNEFDVELLSNLKKIGLSNPEINKLTSLKPLETYRILKEHADKDYVVCISSNKLNQEEGLKLFEEAKEKSIFELCLMFKRDYRSLINTYEKVLYKVVGGQI